MSCFVRAGLVAICLLIATSTQAAIGELTLRNWENSTGTAKVPLMKLKYNLSVFFQEPCQRYMFYYEALDDFSRKSDEAMIKARLDIKGSAAIGADMLELNISGDTPELARFSRSIAGEPDNPGALGTALGIKARLLEDPRVLNVQETSGRVYHGGEGTDHNYTHPEDIEETHYLDVTCLAKDEKNVRALTDQLLSK